MNYYSMTTDELVDRIRELQIKVDEYKNKVVELNLVDETTNLMNRKALYNVLEYEINRMTRLPSYLNLTLITIDNLKIIEEEYGVDLKDIMLELIASTIQHNIRISDVAGRYDYNTFMIISPDINGFKGAILAERLQNKIQHYEYPTDIKIFTSASVVHHQGESTIRFIDKAESYLKLSKKEGKNRIVTSIRG